MRQFFDDFSGTAVLAGLLAVVVSYVGSAVIIFQAASLAGLSAEVTASWIWAVSIGSGVTGILLSWRMRIPIVTAWSTPGAALLVGMLPNIAIEEAIGAYLVSALIIVIIGITGSLDKLMQRIPSAVSAGMFAGILFGFGAKVFSIVPRDPVLVIAMILCFLMCKRFLPRYAIAAVMLVGIGISVASGLINLGGISIKLVHPVFIRPAWSMSTIVSLGVPLALVTITGQYIARMAVLRASGYNVRANGIMVVTGAASMLLAPFGAHAINLSSLTAAICTGREAHENQHRRYVAGIICGSIYIVVGMFGTTLTDLFGALPAVFVAVLAGLALVSAFTTGFIGIFSDTRNMDAGIISFLATASGLEFLGFGAPFWGLVMGSLNILYF